MKNVSKKSSDMTEKSINPLTLIYFIMSIIKYFDSLTQNHYVNKIEKKKQTANCKRNEEMRVEKEDIFYLQ